MGAGAWSVFISNSLISQILGTTLHGISSFQCVRYFQKFPNDGRVRPTLVIVIWFATTLEILCGSYSTHAAIISSFTYAAPPPPAWVTYVQAAVLTSTLVVVQLYLSWTVYQLSRSVVLFMGLCAIALVSTGLIASGEVVIVLRAWGRLGNLPVNFSQPLLISGSVLNAISDLSLGMILYMLLSRRRSGVPSCRPYVYDAICVRVQLH